MVRRTRKMQRPLHRRGGVKLALAIRCRIDIAARSGVRGHRTQRRESVSGDRRGLLRIDGGHASGRRTGEVTVSSIQLRRLYSSIERLKKLLDVQLICVASFALIASATLFWSSSAVAENGIPTACTPVVSPDQRLRMEQWAIDGHCASPVQSRVTDRYLGFTCSKGPDTITTCRRPQPPAFVSKAFRMGRFRQCFDAVVTSTEMEFVVNSVREWVTAEPSKCEWDPHVTWPIAHPLIRTARMHHQNLGSNI